jgi:hypothetical protein
VLLLDPSEISIVPPALSKSLSRDATKFRSAFLLLVNIGWSTGGEARSYAKRDDMAQKPGTQMSGQNL